MVTNERLIIVGSGGMGRDALWFAREGIVEFDIIGMLDDDPATHGTLSADCPVLGGIDEWPRHNASLVVAIGSPRIRRQIVSRIEAAGRARWATVIHRSVQHSPYVKWGQGTIIGAGTTLTTQVQVGNHAIINTGCRLAHDVVMGDFTTLAPNVALSGAVKLEDGAEVGTGACLRQGIVVGRGGMVGMGGVALNDIAPNTLAMGVPARPRRSISSFDMD